MMTDLSDYASGEKRRLMIAVLASLKPSDQSQLQLTDDQFKAFKWDEVRRLIEKNELMRLRRWPSDLKVYFKWKQITLQKYASIEAFVIKERLRWSEDRTPADPKPYHDPRKNIFSLLLHTLTNLKATTKSSTMTFHMHSNRM